MMALMPQKAAGPPFSWGVCHVNGTQHYQYYAARRLDIKDGDHLQLVRVTNNLHDPDATAICRTRNLVTQIGWVPMKISRQIATLLVDNDAWAVVHEHRPNRSDANSRLWVQVYYTPKTAYVPIETPDEFVLMGLNKCSQDPNGQNFERLVSCGPGHGFKLHTTDTRTSVTLSLGGTDVAWFRKSELPEGLLAELDQYRAVRLGQDEDGLVKLVRSRHVSKEEAQRDCAGYTALAVGTLAAGTLSGAVMYSTSGPKPVGKPPVSAKEAINQSINQALKDAREASKNTQPKETTMDTKSITNAVSNAFAANKAAAATAGYMEAGRIANNQAARLAGKHLPLMLRGYADTALGKLVIANIAALAAQQLRPNDPTLAQLTNAMTVQAFQEIYQSVDIEGMLNSLLSSPEMQAAVSKLPKDSAPATPAPFPSQGFYAPTPNTGV